MLLGWVMNKEEINSPTLPYQFSLFTVGFSKEIYTKKKKKTKWYCFIIICTSAQYPSKFLGKKWFK